MKNCIVTCPQGHAIFVYSNLSTKQMKEVIYCKLNVHYWRWLNSQLY